MLFVDTTGTAGYVAIVTIISSGSPSVANKFNNTDMTDLAAICSVRDVHVALSYDSITFYDVLLLIGPAKMGGHGNLPKVTRRYYQPRCC